MKVEPVLTCHFEYRDRDTALEEAAEIMAHCEAPLLAEAQQVFSKYFTSATSWADTQATTQKQFILTQLELLESTIAQKRYEAGLALQYIAQGMLTNVIIHSPVTVMNRCIMW